MKLEHLLLGLIIRKPSTGYTIMKHLDLVGKFLRSNTTMSQVYRSLARMKERGWVDFAVDERPGAKDAKIYRVTPEGQTIFMSWLTGPYTPPSRFQDPDLTARLALGAGFLSEQEVLELIDIELEARRTQQVRDLERDRSFDWDAPAGANVEFAHVLADRLHIDGTRALANHISSLDRLRTDLLDGLLHQSPQHENTTAVRIHS